jgi:phosphoglycolate phosphatase-like HAD superfamily hydrolase
MVGDSVADMQAARACGMRAVLVRTGEAHDTAAAFADHVFDDVLKAARFIVSANSPSEVAA